MNMLNMVAYWLPKAGTPTSEWEDGVAYSPGSGWFAVSDGASTGGSSREWAYTLASCFINDRATSVFDPDGAGFVGWIKATRGRFDPRSAEFPASQMPEWVQAAGARQGSYATFLGGRVSGSEVRAVAAGDCCLFQLRADGSQPATFPLSSKNQFGTKPLLISSSDRSDEHLTTGIGYYRSAVGPGDVVFAASDALAEWLISNLKDPSVWHALSRIDHLGFRDLCADLRSRRAMKNDDVTLWRATAAATAGAGR